MKHSSGSSGPSLTSYLLAFMAVTLFWVQSAEAITSPYVTQQTDVPLNQSTNDSINGVLPYFNSHTPIEGSLSSFSDATSATAPNANVVAGPDNTWIGVAWDLGDPGAGFMWRLDRIDIWITAGDDLRKGFHGDFSVSSTGNVDEFTIIPNSEHWAGLAQNSQYNYLRYDFPDHFIAGASTNMDKYPVTAFRYLRLNSRGDSINGTDWQSRFVELDAWVTKIAQPSETPSITSVTRNGGDITLIWSAISGRTYDVEYVLDLNGTNWINLQTVVADSSSESFTDPSPADSKRFYRIVLEP